ncbi:unnamed protein product, partial [Nesidiocoris tenuis]
RLRVPAADGIFVDHVEKHDSVIGHHFGRRMARPLAESLELPVRVFVRLSFQNRRGHKEFPVAGQRVEEEESVHWSSRGERHAENACEREMRLLRIAWSRWRYAGYQKIGIIFEDTLSESCILG